MVGGGWGSATARGWAVVLAAHVVWVRVRRPVTSPELAGGLLPVVLVADVGARVRVRIEEVVVNGPVDPVECLVLAAAGLRPVLEMTVKLGRCLGSCRPG